jgi:GT2 family glycosyltransferase
VNPKVSVIITTYRRPALLVEAIESVLAQSYRDFELIVADDGSGDETAAQVATYGHTVRYLPLPHSGKPEVGRNHAVALARGRFLAFLDDDDLWHKEKLARQMSVFNGHAEVGYSYTDIRFVEEDGSLSPPALPPQHKQSSAVFDNLLQGCFVHPSTVLMRRRLFEQVGPFDESLLCQGDYDLWLRAAQATRVACVPEPLVHVRRYHRGLSDRRQLANVESAIEALSRLRERHPLTLRQRLVSRRTLSRWHAHLGLHRTSVQAARRDLLRSLRLNPLQRTAWVALISRGHSAG